MLMTDSNGNPSLTHTLSVIAFAIVMLKILFGGADIVIGSFSYSFGTIDALSIAAVLTPTLGAYVARRYSPTASDTSAGSKPGDGAA